jgi:hypothetical protein
MTNADPLPPTVLRRKAVVYVRQSTQTQVQVHLESQRRQYDLVDEARRHGFRDVEVIDDDLGRSASGTVARPGFEKLVAGLCAGEVGAVLCFDASRLARNGRDWHHLLELCGLVDARVIDLDGVYNPCRPNDHLLLGMKGSISEFAVLCSNRHRRKWACTRRLRLPEGWRCFLVVGDDGAAFPAFSGGALTQRRQDHAHVRPRRRQCVPPAALARNRRQPGVSRLRLRDLLRLPAPVRPSAMAVQGVPPGLLHHLGHLVRLAQAAAADLPARRRHLLQ